MRSIPVIAACVAALPLAIGLAVLIAAAIYLGAGLALLREVL